VIVNVFRNPAEMFVSKICHRSLSRLCYSKDHALSSQLWVTQQGSRFLQCISHVYTILQKFSGNSYHVHWHLTAELKLGHSPSAFGVFAYLLATKARETSRHTLWGTCHIIPGWRDKIGCCSSGCDQCAIIDLDKIVPINYDGLHVASQTVSWLTVNAQHGDTHLSIRSSDNRNCPMTGQYSCVRRKFCRHRLFNHATIPTSKSCQSDFDLIFWVRLAVASFNRCKAQKEIVMKRNVKYIIVLDYGIFHT
jgi:hypothetical protein